MLPTESDGQYSWQDWKDCRQDGQNGWKNFPRHFDAASVPPPPHLERLILYLWEQSLRLMKDSFNITLWLFKTRLLPSNFKISRDDLKGCFKIGIGLNKFIFQDYLETSVRLLERYPQDYIKTNFRHVKDYVKSINTIYLAWT